MQPQTASYYRAVLFGDITSMMPIPESLIKLHQWTVRRHQYLGLGGMLTKAMAMTVALTWMSSTVEGREFTRTNTTLGDLFSWTELDEDTLVTADELSAVPQGTEVIVTMPDGSTKSGLFISRKGSWADITVDGEVRKYRTSKVRLAIGV